MEMENDLLGMFAAFLGAFIGSSIREYLRILKNKERDNSNGQ